MESIDQGVGRREVLERRDVLAATGSLAAVGLAGCLGSGREHPEAEKQLPTPVAGDPDAAVTVASFESFACGHCRTYSLQVFPRVWNEYVTSGEIAYEWYDYPIPDHDRHAWLAADAARAVQAAADSAETFWLFVDGLFRHQDALSLDLYERAANELGLDGARIREQTSNRTYEPTVVASKQVGNDRGVSGTPTVFVDGEKLTAPNLQELSTAIDAALAGT